MSHHTSGIKGMPMPSGDGPPLTMLSSVGTTTSSLSSQPHLAIPSSPADDWNKIHRLVLPNPGKKRFDAKQRVTSAGGNVQPVPDSTSLCKQRTRTISSAQSLRARARMAQFQTIRSAAESNFLSDTANFEGETSASPQRLEVTPQPNPYLMQQQQEQSAPVIGGKTQSASWKMTSSGANVAGGGTGADENEGGYEHFVMQTWRVPPALAAGLSTGGGSAPSPRRKEVSTEGGSVASPSQRRPKTMKERPHDVNINTGGVSTVGGTEEGLLSHYKSMSRFHSATGSNFFEAELHPDSHSNNVSQGGVKATPGVASASLVSFSDVQNEISTTTAGPKDHVASQKKSNEQQLALTAATTKYMNSLPWWKRIVFDPIFRRKICSAVTKAIRQDEIQFGRVMKEKEGMGGAASMKQAPPVVKSQLPTQTANSGKTEHSGHHTAHLIPPFLFPLSNTPQSLYIAKEMWDPASAAVRTPGNGITYRWLTAFPPTGWANIHLGSTKPTKEGRYCVNVFAEAEADPYLEAQLLAQQPALGATPDGRKGDDATPVEMQGAKEMLAAAGERGGQAQQQGNAGATMASAATGGGFIGTLRIAFRVIRWRYMCNALHEFMAGLPTNRAEWPHKRFLDGVRVAKEGEISGYVRDDMTDARRMYLFNSDISRKALRRIYIRLEKDINGRVTKPAFIDFTLDLINLFLPSFHSRSNIDLAEDEWICRGTKDKPDFLIFYQVFFDFPLLIMRTEYVNEELYSHFWEFVSQCLFVDHMRNTDRYCEHTMAQELLHSSEVANQPANRRAFLVYRKAEMEANKKQREKKLQKLRHEMAIQQADEMGLSRSGMNPQDDTAMGVASGDSRPGTPADMEYKARAGGGRHLAPPMSSNKTSSYALYEETFTTPQMPKDEIDDLLDYCSDFSDSDFEDEHNSIRSRYDNAQQMKQQREQYRSSKRNQSGNSLGKKPSQGRGGLLVANIQAAKDRQKTEEEHLLRAGVLGSRGGFDGSPSTASFQGSLEASPASSFRMQLTGGTDLSPKGSVRFSKSKSSFAKQQSTGGAERSDSTDVESESGSGRPSISSSGATQPLPSGFGAGPEEDLLGEPNAWVEAEPKELGRPRLSAQRERYLRQQERKRLHAEADNHRSKKVPESLWYRGPLQRASEGKGMELGYAKASLVGGEVPREDDGTEGHYETPLGPPPQEIEQIDFGDDSYLESPEKIFEGGTNQIYQSAVLLNAPASPKIEATAMFMASKGLQERDMRHATQQRNRDPHLSTGGTHSGSGSRPVSSRHQQQSHSRHRHGAGSASLQRSKAPPSVYAVSYDGLVPQGAAGGGVGMVPTPPPTGAFQQHHQTRPSTSPIPGTRSLVGKLLDAGSSEGEATTPAPDPNTPRLVPTRQGGDGATPTSASRASNPEKALHHIYAQDEQESGQLQVLPSGPSASGGGSSELVVPALKVVGSSTEIAVGQHDPLGISQELSGEEDSFCEEDEILWSLGLKQKPHSAQTKQVLAKAAKPSHIFEDKFGRYGSAKQSQEESRKRSAGKYNVVPPGHRCLPYVDYTSSIHVPGVEETVLQRHVHHKELGEGPRPKTTETRKQNHSATSAIGIGAMKAEVEESGAVLVGAGNTPPPRTYSRSGSPHPTLELVKKLYSMQKEDQALKALATGHATAKSDTMKLAKAEQLLDDLQGPKMHLLGGVMLQGQKALASTAPRAKDVKVSQTDGTLKSYKTVQSKLPPALKKPAGASSKAGSKR